MRLWVSTIVVCSICTTLGFAGRHVVSREIDLWSHPLGGDCRECRQSRHSLRIQNRECRQPREIPGEEDLTIDQDEIRHYIGNAFDGVDVFVASKENGAPEVAWGDTFFIYDPDRNLPDPKRFPFATIVTQDYGEFDNASNLNRPGVFRLNIGVSKETFAKLFSAEGEHDFAELDRLMPHPVYGRNHFVCVLNPSDSTFETIKPLLREAYEIAVGRIKRRQRTG